ncbi:MAG TPA: threonine ammonia-lyase, biosynthetic [Alphaproteobacteria bacterium]|nr:threonine ammonia-lyase, biosynthetic [Alphaproteobacteria bacterium]
MRSSDRPQFIMARAVMPIFSTSCGSTRMMTGAVAIISNNLEKLDGAGLLPYARSVPKEYTMLHNYIKKILTAPVYDVAIQSPLDPAPVLSTQTGRKIWLKREDLQPIFSFKLRGAYTKIMALDEKTRAKGVITASAGNHAQGVALAAKKLKIKAVIVMTATTPEIKVKAVQSHGAEVVLHGDALSDAFEHAHELAKKRNLTFVHPYDDPDVIAGQGTIGMEILRQHSGPIEAIFVPIGGGGLISGIATYVKFVKPGIKIIGVEPDDADSMYQALKAKKRVDLGQVGLFADGVAVRMVGEETFRISRELVDEVIRVNTDEICAAIKDIFTDTRSVAEPAGALSVAAVKKYVEKKKDVKGDLIAVVSGANINFDRLRHVAERTAVGEKREMLLAVELPETPGALLKFCNLLGKRSITEFNYRYFSDKEAHIFVGVQVQDYEKEGAAFQKKLKDNGFTTLDMTENELAKEHIRYMVGGRPPKLMDEVLYRFEFPERPGALLKFLTSLNYSWNISLFHYRNHGAAYGRVLMGLQVPKAQRVKLEKLITQMGFAYTDETHNPAYRTFLKN